MRGNYCKLYIFNWEYVQIIEGKNQGLNLNVVF